MHNVYYANINSGVIIPKLTIENTILRIHDGRRLSKQGYLELLLGIKFNPHSIITTPTTLKM
ncbi:hypothetical protein BpHYR1_024718 [Brachionus plicatilis]|uniref:Uncharacterized protein n=1 Tax=Brachionus plicatilis TaxID=10195 RepID=A0A3M7SPP4_BRAPC|nr:hypothetical protein BpHYR1_024718 [Brachionus plicatilis]